MPLDLTGIRYRLEHPESVPGKSWWTVYREDIKSLLEEIENERRKERDAKGKTQVHG